MSECTTVDTGADDLLARQARGDQVHCPKMEEYQLDNLLHT
jgi:hypothetical protein